MARGRRAEGFASHVIGIPKRKKKAIIKKKKIKIIDNTGRVERYQKAKTCPYFNKFDNHCNKHKSGTKYCSLIWNLPDKDCVGVN